MTKGSPFTTPEEFLISSPVVAAIADLGLGNAASVANMCRRLGFEVRLSADPTGIEAADLVVLPGVGAWDAGMDRLHATGWGRALVEAAAAEKHVLGICLGMQLLSESSAEEPHQGSDCSRADLNGSRASGGLGRGRCLIWVGIACCSTGGFRCRDARRRSLLLRPLV